jgi:release factor glutamine methyltransferase
MARDTGDVWTIRSALDWIVGYLSSRHDEHPRLSAEWLLADATGLSRVELYAYYDRPLEPDERKRLHEGVARRGRGEPLQYISGEVAFRHVVINAERGVLIPRPETEVLVDVALEAVDEAIEQRGSALACDVGTGTGNIAASLLAERQGVRVVATDVSQAAVELATRNIASLGLEERCTIYQCDLVDAVPREQDGTFDLLVSNPPYIPTDELAELPREVGGFEPVLALDGGPDGLDVFRRILACGTRLLRPGGMLACELHETRLQEAAELCAGYYDDVRIVPDLTGRDRIVRAVLK